MDVRQCQTADFTRSPHTQRLRRVTRLERIFIVFCLSIFTTMTLIIWNSNVGVTSEDCILSQQHEPLQQQIKTLQENIKVLEHELEKHKKINGALQSDTLSPDDDRELYEQKLKDSKDDIRFLMDEHDVIQYASFTQEYIYAVTSGKYGRVLERLEGVRKKDIQEVIMLATSNIYASRRNNSERFIFTDGIFRTDPGIGTRYEIYFKSSIDQSAHHKISVFRPFGPLYFIGGSASNARSDIIHMIMPLAGRTDILWRFLSNFVHTIIKPRENVILTIVYSGTKGLNETTALIENIKSKHAFSGINLIKVRGKFSRGRAIQTAVGHLPENALMFFCDVDVIYHSSFLQRCRLNTQRGNKVFYPIIFSLYNPEVVYALQDVRKPRERDLYVVSSEVGFWRDFGYGMTCQYKGDFMRLGGFQQHINGWGMEDVLLFRKYAQSNISIVRSVDHDLFHTWHEKKCEQSLSWNQFKACIGSKAEASSHGLLGMMAFSDEVASYKKRHGMMHHINKPRG